MCEYNVREGHMHVTSRYASMLQWPMRRYRVMDGGRRAYFV
jgi:hypothetical protein